MFFLYPILLSFAAVVSVPILIHLFSKRPPRELRLPTSILLIELNRKQHFMRFKTIRNLLLLIIRVLILLLLILPFAGLVLKKTISPTGPDEIIPPRQNGNLVFMVDISNSMAYNSEGENSIERARQTVNTLLETYKPETVSLYSFTTGITELVPVQKPHYDFKERFNLLKPTLLSANCKRAIPALRRRLQELNRSQSDIVIITDMQKNVFPGMTDLNSIFYPYFRSISVVDCAPYKPGNCAIKDWQCHYQKGKLVIDFTVINSGAINQNWKTQLYDNKGIVIKSSQRSGVLKPGQTSPCQVAIPQADQYWHGTIKLSEDSFERDNIVHLSYSPPKPPLCFILTADQKTSTIHVAAALKSLGSKQKLKSQSGTLKEWQALSEKVNLLILDNAKLLGNPEVENFIANGGKAIVFTGNQDIKQSLLQVQFNGLNKTKTPLPFKRTDQHGPFHEAFWFQPLLDWRLKINSPLSITENKKMTVFARYSDHTPAIFSTSYGKGQAIFLNFSCSASTGGPVNNIEFVMLLHRLVGNILPPLGNQADQVSYGQHYPFKNQTGSSRFLLASPTLKVKEFSCPAYSAMQLPLTDGTGIYEIRTLAGDIVKSLAVNINPTESDFVKRPPLKALFRQAAGSTNQASNINSNYVRTFLTILLVILLLLLAELIIDWRNK